MPATDAYPIITFISTSPTTEFAIEPYGNGDQERPSAGVSPGFLPQVFDTLRTQGAVPSNGLPDPGDHAPHLIVRVASISSIAQWLDKYLNADGEASGPDKVRIQIIGHSSSGELQLGASWSSVQPLLADVEPYYVLSSNPHSLYELYPFMGRISEVMLAGCYVGQRLTDGNPVNGRTLMFTLAEMWHCKVRGAVSSVQAADFKNGWFDGEIMGWAWNHADDSANKEPASPFRPTVTAQRLPALHTVTAPGTGASLDAAQRAQFSTYFDAALAPELRPNLAAAELTLTLGLDRGDGQAEHTQAAIVGNGKYLRVSQNGETTYYANQAESEATSPAAIPNSLQGLLRHLRKRKAPPASSASALAS